MGAEHFYKSMLLKIYLIWFHTLSGQALKDPLFLFKPFKCYLSFELRCILTLILHQYNFNSEFALYLLDLQSE